MVRLATIFFCLFSFINTIASQVEINPITADSSFLSADTSVLISSGFATWHLPVGFNSLVELYKKDNYREPGLDGYRIQVFSDGGNNAKERALKLVSEIEESHPNIPVYLSYHQPNFKVRCGNYRTKAEARKNQGSICKSYPGCFIVKDLILVNEPKGD